MAARDIIQAAAGAAGATEAVYVEDVFSTYLHTGTGASQTINNGIDLATKGGMVWIKCRQADGHKLFDTVRGAQNRISSSSTAAQASDTALTSFTSTGYVDQANWFTSNTVASWTFRKQPKFFDVVTFTGNGVAGRQITHSLGATPGMVIVKRTDTTSDWAVWHRGDGTTWRTDLSINTTAASGWSGTSSPHSSTTFNTTYITPNGGMSINESGGTYVAYLFAHNAGGFGPAGTDSVVACGSYTAPSGGTLLNVNLGWEPQFVMVKRSSSTGGWLMMDTMRGMPVPTATEAYLYANSSIAESSFTAFLWPYASGFALNGNASTPEISNPGDTYIYLAIRRGPMKTPTDATKVFNTIARTGTGSSTSITGVGFAPDAVFALARSGQNQHVQDKLRGPNRPLWFAYTFAEDTAATGSVESFTNDGINIGADTYTIALNSSGVGYATTFFRRAPGFFDVVCYTGTGTNRTVAHNLGVAPELMIVKGRAGAGAIPWTIYSAALSATKFLDFNSGGQESISSIWNNTEPTPSVFSVGTAGYTNGSSNTYVAYLFATCPGVSKVGSYTGSGTTKQIDCGFTSGARFVLIKRTDSTGSWYVWDTARGLVSGNDPYLLLNSTAAEVTNTDYIDPYSAGFEISSTAPAEINASGGSFVFLAIA